jgi:signal peptidase I
MCFKASWFLAMALYLNVIAALSSVFSSLFLLSFSLFYVTIYAILSISMQLCVTSVIKLVRFPYAKNDLDVNICYVFTACYIKCLSLCNRCEILPVHVTYSDK